MICTFLALFTWITQVIYRIDEENQVTPFWLGWLRQIEALSHREVEYEFKEVFWLIRERSEEPMVPDFGGGEATAAKTKL